MTDLYLIHKASRGWYRPNSKGYTMLAHEAGRYTIEDAIRITHPNGPDGPRDGLTYKRTGDVPFDASCEKETIIHDLTMERDLLAEQKEDICSALSLAFAQIETLKIVARHIGLTVDDGSSNLVRIEEATND